MRTLLYVVAAILIFVLGFAWYVGCFTNVAVEDRVEGGYTVVGVDFTGSYSKSGKSMMEVDDKLKAMGIICSRSFGIYYDDPKTTPSDKCRSFVGGILEEKDLGRITALKESGLKIDSVAKSTSVIAEFPIKNSFSYMIGPMKAYPVISKYIVEKKYNITVSLEIYDLSSKKITYIMQYKK